MSAADSGTVAALLGDARERLSAQTDTPNLDAQLLMMKTLQQPRAWLLAHGEYQLTEAQANEFGEYVQRCASGTALPYVLGWWEFYGRQFHVSPQVLVPRPETELMVEVSLQHLNRSADIRIHVLEVGCGSGCVIASLALEAPNHSYTATEFSWGALEVASRNLAHYRLQSDVGLVQADLASCVGQQQDLIVANLPYVPSARLNKLAVGKKEPRRALDGGSDGMNHLRQLVADLARILSPGGLAALEMDPDQFDEIEAHAAGKLPGCRTERYRDLAGHDRVLTIERTAGRGDGR